MCGSSTPAAATVSPPAVQRDPGVRGVLPAALQHGGAQVAPRQRHAVLALRALHQVAGGVLEGGAEVVVAAEDEQARDVQQRAERGQGGGDGAGVGEVVAGVDDEVGLQLRQRGHPALLAALAGRDVQVGHVQHPSGRAPSASTGSVAFAQRPVTALDARRVGDARHPRGDRAEREPSPSVHVPEGSVRP